MKGVLAMPLSMTLEPVQKQQLTQHLIQQMNLLQMTSEELDAFVAREVEQNPLLDFPEERETWREEGPEWRRMHLSGIPAMIPLQALWKMPTPLK